MLLKSKVSKSDVCLLFEGSYPFVEGGVSTWAHDLIRSQPHLTFSIVNIIAPKAPREQKYAFPKNVVDFQVIELQYLPKEKSFLQHLFFKTEGLSKTLQTTLPKLLKDASLKDFETLVRTFKEAEAPLDTHTLLETPEAWALLTKMYEDAMPTANFLDYFWSWRTLVGSLYSILRAPLPKADCYHAVCTGYAGLLLAKASLQEKKPCLLTEHGIYTNERHIEVVLADWLKGHEAQNLQVGRHALDLNIKDFWLNAFTTFAKLTYEASRTIITLYEENQDLQRRDGAPQEKLQIIPNGVDIEKFSAIEHLPRESPTIALLGRVVPIKDIKSYIRACKIMCETLPNLKALVIGPMDEDPLYYEECLDLVHHEGLEDHITFTGKVDIKAYLGHIDVLVLTSLSESQPLVILEAGAAGIPTVATDVGSCRELIEGRPKEQQTATEGNGGTICSLACPPEIAQATLKLLTDKTHYTQCSNIIKKRVQTHYTNTLTWAQYRDLYESILHKTHAA